MSFLDNRTYEKLPYIVQKFFTLKIQKGSNIQKSSILSVEPF